MFGHKNWAERHTKTDNTMTERHPGKADKVQHSGQANQGPS